MKRWVAFAVVIILAVLLSIFIIGTSSKAEKKYTAIYDLPQKNPPQLIAKFFANLNFALAPQSKKAMKECFYPYLILQQDFEEKYKILINKIKFPKNSPFVFAEVEEVLIHPLYINSDKIKVVKCKIKFIPKNEEDDVFCYYPQIYYFTVVKGENNNWYFVDVTPLVSLNFPPSYYK